MRFSPSWRGRVVAGQLAWDTGRVASSRWKPLIVAAAVLLLGAAAEPAAGAPPQFLGENPLSTKGGCTLCSAVQLTNSSSPSSYVAPSQGVLTKISFYVGPFTEAGDYVQARTFRRSGMSDATVISQGEKHLISGFTTGSHSFFERIPVIGGDVLGGRFKTTPFIDGTPHMFETSSTSDEVGLLNSPADPEVGDIFTSLQVAKRRVNMRALFEPDEDGDGYGDTSQDLCLGSPVGAGACSGTLLGSDLQGPFLVIGHNCTFACLHVQLKAGGASTAAPFDGVIVRWRLLAAPSGTYRIRVLDPQGGSSYRVAGSSAAQAVTASSFKEITVFPTRLPIAAGGYVGLVPPTFTIQAFKESAPGSTYTRINDGSDGDVLSLGGVSSIGAELLYDVDIEPDADHDGFGDVTQDACPANGSTQGVCPPLPVAIVDKVSEKRFCRGKEATQVGTAGKDDLKGTKRDDVIVALGGNDTIKALAGDDLACAGDGKDVIFGGSGKDRLIGEKGADSLRGGPGKDTLIGGPGKDTLLGGPGKDLQQQ
jgi:hypothetical protein